MFKTLNNKNFWFVLRDAIEKFRLFGNFRIRNNRSELRHNWIEAAQAERAIPNEPAARHPSPAAPPSEARGMPKHARLLAAGMGSAFAQLPADIQARFAHTLREEPLRFVGTMERIRLHPLGWVLAQLTRMSGLIPTRTGQDVGFEFNVRPLGMSWLKHRCYHFDSGPFHFSSVMTLDPDGCFVERFRGGLGMRLALTAEGQNLVFRDCGYFLHWRRWRLNLPTLLHPGRFLLVHENVDARHFNVQLSLRHRWFGTLIMQNGRFRNELLAGH